MKQTLSIIGAGKVGRVLGQLFQRHQIFTIQDVMTQSVASAENAREFIGAGTIASTFSALRPADLFMISVPDDQIKSCSQQLQKRGILTPKTIVFHCSGALDSSELCLQTGALSIHPLRSFADPQYVAQHFIPTLCTMEGDEKAARQLVLPFQKIGTQIVPIQKEGKPLYHAAAVFASNYMVTILDSAFQAFKAAGIDHDTAERMLKPLAQETFNNIFDMGTQRALTGPVARGDVQTIKRHHEALKKWDKGTAALYLLLAKATKAMKDRELKSE